MKKNNITTKSQHLLLDVWLSTEISDQLICNIKNIIYANLTVVNELTHKFSPYGETIVLILSESHFTIHTYPEHHYLTMDLYICNKDIDLSKIKDLIIKECNCLKSNDQIIIRG